MTSHQTMDGSLFSQAAETTQPAEQDFTPGKQGGSSSGDGPYASEGETELRKDSMMAHLLDSLAAGKDIGHFGRLVFAMVARHFLSHQDVIAWLTRDPDLPETEAVNMLRQVEARDYNPPKRDRLLEWQAQQDFPILPQPEDPDCGNLYRNLKFPDSIYEHISHYQEQKANAEQDLM
ncbi:MAG TPA: hypothetical protein VMB49_17300 [Acidobacteriaceae bacterium]|nr:hypothetical protein [Acidobacteriaceae bacterium]